MVKSQGIQPDYLDSNPASAGNQPYLTRGHYLISMYTPMSTPASGDNNSTNLRGFWKRLNECVCVRVCALEQWPVENITYMFTSIGGNGSHDNNNNN